MNLKKWPIFLLLIWYRKHSLPSDKFLRLFGNEAFSIVFVKKKPRKRKPLCYKHRQYGEKKDKGRPYVAKKGRGLVCLVNIKFLIDDECIRHIGDMFVKWLISEITDQIIQTDVAIPLEDAYYI